MRAFARRCIDGGNADAAEIGAMTEGARQRALTHFTDVSMAQRYRDRFTVLEVENQGLSGP
jgi:hypothetical protein